MNAVFRVETTDKNVDGELHLTDLPCRRGDKVEAIVLILEPSGPSPDGQSAKIDAIPVRSDQILSRSQSEIIEAEFVEH